RRTWMAGLIVILFAGSGAVAADDANLVVALEKLGARITRDASQPGMPVVAVGLGETAQDADIKQLKKLEHLRTVRLLSKFVTSDGLRDLGALHDLRGLSLYGPNFTDASLQSLSNLQALQNLDLTGTRITDAGMGGLFRFNKLQSLGLSGTQVTDQGFSTL